MASSHPSVKDSPNYLVENAIEEVESPLDSPSTETDSERDVQSNKLEGEYEDQEIETESSDSDLDLDSDAEVDPTDESLSTTIIQEIDDGTYICLVCTCEIDRHLEIWSCQNCYRVYDLECINDWATRGSSTNAQNEWRCPACNVEHRTIPSKFTCWCGRVTRPSADTLIPFSCGNPCNVKYPHCVHSCSSVCHPGKHPECGALGPVMNCRCGKHNQQLPCLVTPYQMGWTCDTPCDTVVCEMDHKCSGGCHLGFCGPCKDQVDVRCYCGIETKTIVCLAIDPKVCYEKENRNERFVGGTSCNNTIVEYYECGIHSEELTCQPLSPSTLKCKFDPANVKTCYCGKTPAHELRSKCTDPMPECDQVCGKLLKCGCTCLAKCHEGDCECYNIIETKCSCNNASYLVPCKALQQGFVAKCRHKCTAALSCRKHYHREECCEFEQIALKREREQRKQVRNRVRTNFEDLLLTMEPIHICTRTCNLLKPCGSHYCEAMCHSGPCGVCLESSNEDLVCHCGKTVIPAPVRCGTKIVCQEQCVREKECGHAPEPHRCHDDNKQCPKCTKLVEKTCNCGAKLLKHVLCSVTNVSCGRICNSKLQCGHVCNRACSHDCVEGRHADVAACRLTCRKIRKNCPHMCQAKCHYSKKTPCDATICKEEVVITCECGRMSRKVPCGALMALPTKIGTIFGCDDECARIKREEELKSIFHNSPATHESTYPESVTSVFRRQVNWCLKMESIIRNFVSDYMDCVAAKLPAKKSLHFPPMMKPQREFLHNLAEVYRLYSESQDREPMRSVFLCITNLSVLPTLTIRQALDKEEDMERKRIQLEEMKLSQLNEAFFNAILIQDVFFGVTKEEVEKKVNEILENHPEIKESQLEWIKDSTYVFYDKHFAEMDKDKENELYILLKTFKKVLREKLIAFDCKMCLVNEDVDLILKTDLNNVVASTVEEKEKPEGSNNLYSILQNQEQEVES